jgi:hypothetical protein
MEASLSKRRAVQRLIKDAAAGRKSISEAKHEIADLKREKDREDREAILRKSPRFASFSNSRFTLYPLPPENGASPAVRCSSAKAPPA